MKYAEAVEKLQEFLDTVNKELKKQREKIEPYQFQAGDVAEVKWNNGDVDKRFIVFVGGELVAIDLNDGRGATRGQRGFEAYGYRKIGELKDYFPRG